MTDEQAPPHPPPLTRLVEAYEEGLFEDPVRARLLKAAVSSDPTVAALAQARQVIDNRHLQFLVGQYSRGELRERDLAKLVRLYRGDEGYNEDIVASLATSDFFLEDPDFRRAYEAGSSVSVWGSPIRWRVYTLLSCGLQAAKLTGDFVECGVDRGGMTTCVIEYLGTETFKNRRFRLFDTFSGLVESQLSETERKVNERRKEAGRYPDVFDEVKKRFEPIEFVELVRGPIPATLEHFPPGPVAYLHIDMNAALPECAAFEFFWPFLVPGAPVVFDDYGFPFHTNQRDQLAAVAEKLGTQIMMLPTGQGLCWKL